MADQEVEKILQEIRDRVRASNAPVVVTESNSVTLTTAPVEPATAVPLDSSFDRRFAGLSTLERAWDQLPPLVSNRSGGTARLELWLKARFKRLLRWITWEQVNFNAAVHHTLREMAESLMAHEQALQSKAEIASTKPLEKQFLANKGKIEQIHFAVNQLTVNSQLIRSELTGEIQHRREAIAAHLTELNLLRSDISTHRQEITDIAETQLLELVARCEGLQTQRNEVENELNLLQARLAVLEGQNQVQRDTISAQLTAYEADRQETTKQVAGLLAELRQRDDRLLQEQRVCFKQLSLEANETAVLKERVYRELTERLDRLEIDRLETEDRAGKQDA